MTRARQESDAAGGNEGGGDTDEARDSRGLAGVEVGKAEGGDRGAAAGEAAEQGAEPGAALGGALADEAQEE